MNPLLTNTVVNILQFVDAESALILKRVCKILHDCVDTIIVNETKSIKRRGIRYDIEGLSINGQGIGKWVGKVIYSFGGSEQYESSVVVYASTDRIKIVTDDNGSYHIVVIYCPLIGDIPVNAVETTYTCQRNNIGYCHTYLGAHSNRAYSQRSLLSSRFMYTWFEPDDNTIEHLYTPGEHGLLVVVTYEGRGDSISGVDPAFSIIEIKRQCYYYKGELIADVRYPTGSGNQEWLVYPLKGYIIDKSKRHNLKRSKIETHYEFLNRYLRALVLATIPTIV